MKTRIERFKNHRNEILYSDDGDLPIAKAKGKHLKKDGNLTTSQVSYKRKKDKDEEEIKKGKTIIIFLGVTLAILIILGFILSL